MDDLDELLTGPEYARERRCSVRTIERERETGTGCRFIKFGRSVRYRRRDVREFIDRHARQSTSETGAMTAPRSPRRSSNEPETGR